MKFFGPGRHRVLRGTAVQLTPKKGFLWTLGYIPRLATYPSREVPNPVTVEESRGEADLQGVMRDVLGLAKVNFNACIYGDGLADYAPFRQSGRRSFNGDPARAQDTAVTVRHYM